MVSLRASTERLTNYLDQFIKLDTGDLEQELTKEEEEEMKEKYRTSIMLTQHINQKTSLEDFKYLIEEAGLEKEWTVTLLDDFDHHEEQNTSPRPKFQHDYNSIMDLLGEDLAYPKRTSSKGRLYSVCRLNPTKYKPFGGISN